MWPWNSLIDAIFPQSLSSYWIINTLTVFMDLEPAGSLHAPAARRNTPGDQRNDTPAKNNGHAVLSQHKRGHWGQWGHVWAVYPLGNPGRCLRVVNHRGENGPGTEGRPTSDVALIYCCPPHSDINGFLHTFYRPYFFFMSSYFQRSV